MLPSSVGSMYRATRPATSFPFDVFSSKAARSSFSASPDGRRTNSGEVLAAIVISRYQNCYRPAMPLTAFVIGGSGLVGAAVVRRLAERGFEVTAAARGRRNPPAGLDEVARLVTVDRSDDAALGAALGDGVDVLVDTAAFRAEDGEQLVALRDRYASVVVLSSASVYTDGAGRSIDEAESPEEFPDLPVPVSERVPTLPAGDATYSTRKVAIERALLGAEGVRPTVIRPGAVYGPHDARPREWFFVKRALDRRPYVVLAQLGESRFHPTAVENLAELVRLAAERPERRVLNCADPEAPTALAIGRAIGGVLAWDPDELLLHGPPRDGVGAHPWATPKPLVLDTTEAEITLGWRPVTRYERAVKATCEHLIEATAGTDWREALPGAAELYGSLFDYAAEDGYLGTLVR
jgi:nucleoside-diphosphate-sugar epimerase